MKSSLILLCVISLCLVEGRKFSSNELSEARGKGKYALLIHFFYVVASKLFVLKIIYGIIFYVLLTKGWHFVVWFIHYLKEKKHHEEYIEHDHESLYFDHGHHDQHYEHDHEPYHGHYDNYGNEEYYQKKRIYDSDGSYSIKGV